jgi:hypothetical protein
MPKTSIGGRHIAKERGLIPAWSGWPFRHEVRHTVAAIHSAKAPRPPKNMGVKGPSPCQA